VLRRLKAHKLSLLRLPAVTELSAEFATLPSALRELSVEELLARPAVNLDLARIYDLVNGRRVLVTGAGGSIGSEICRQVAAFGCAHLSLLDHSEFGLFKIDQEIATAHPDLSRRELICDIRDRGRIERCMAAEAPDIVFHAAALKHVPMVENNPAEGALTNVIGTWNVAEAARAAKAGQMVMISTDKAVDPCNVMGATKRLAEAVVRGQHGRSQTRFSVVRFGNVLGSAGSVAPIFQAQIARGGPVTVTHPDIERYFMTIPEAVQLVLHATAESASRDLSQPSVFVLDMGAPVKIVDLARNMISLQGLTPDVDIQIAFTGLRPGEKLTEDLVDTSERVLAQLQSVMEVVDHTPAARIETAELRNLEGAARAGDEVTVRQQIYDHVARIRGDARRAAG
jgi:O-antigen biosynthesis protein WbqV